MHALMDNSLLYAFFHAEFFLRNIYVRSYWLLGNLMYVLRVLKWPSKRSLSCVASVGGILSLMKLIGLRMKILSFQKQ